MPSSDDEFGDTLDWDDVALEELASLDASVLPSAARGASVQPPPPRASQIPPKRPPPAPQPKPQQQRRPVLPPPGPSQLPFPGAGTQHAHGGQYLGPARANILRPARPPQRATQAAPPPAAPPPAAAAAAARPPSAPAPPPKRFPRQSLNERGEPGAVDPNPFAGRPPPAPAPAPAPALKHEPEEEDLPAISVDEHGGGYRAEPQRGVTVVRPAVQAPPVTKAPPQKPDQTRAANAALEKGAGASLAAEKAGAQGQESALHDAERRELEALRAEKAKLAQQLAIAQKAQEQLEREVMTKTGENSVVRLRLSKAEAAHTIAMKTEQRDRAQLEERLDAKEREYRAALERMKMEDAFRRQELATAAAPGSASSQRHYHHPAHPGLSSAKSQRFYGRAGSAAPGPAASPSVDRGAAAAAGGSRRRGASEAPAAFAGAPPPTFGGFQSAFGPPTSTAGPQREREGSMGPPRKRAAGLKDAPRTPGAAPDAKRRREEGSAREKGKGRMMLVEEEEFGDAEGGEADLGGFEHGDATDEQGDGEEDEADAWAWVPEERDTRNELLAAVFTHTMLAPLDVEPAVVPPSAHPHPHHLRATAGASTFATASTARFVTVRHGTAASTFGARSTAAAPVPTPTAPTGPVPTFHALMNLRFPPSTPPALVAEYESLTRELFTLLGRRLDPYTLSQPASSQLALLPAHLALCTPPEELEAALLATGLARALTSLLGVLEAATLAGAMTALLRLFAHLAFLFPAFASACCTPASIATIAAGRRSEALLPLLARILARFARPDPPARDPSAAALLARGGPLGARTALRSRKARVARPSAGAGAGRKRGGRDGKEEGEERIVLEGAKRGRLVEAVLSVLEGVAWRCLAVRRADDAGDGEGDGGRAAEEAFITFLKTPNAVATLLDPNHPVGVLLGSTRFLSLLACRPALFRTLLATKFYDAPDVRASKLPLVDRLATLLVMPRPESLSAHTLDLSLLTLSSLLLTAHEDAVMLVVQAASFVPELLAKMWRDVRTLWEWDGREAPRGGRAREMLDRTTTRLSALIHLIYYLSLAPHSSLTIADLLAGPSASAASVSTTGSTSAGTAAGGAPGGGKDAPSAPAPAAYARQAVNDLFMTALGTVAFATLGGEDGAGEAEGEGEGGMPSWAEEGSRERRVLCELGYLAQEILEDVSPLELEEVEVCFAAAGEDGGDDAGAGDEGEEMREGEGEDERQLMGVEEGL